MNIIVTGPSGVGKQTLLDAILRSDSTLRKARSTTTRAMRGGEQNGREYDFVGVEEFEAMVARGDFLEHALVHDNWYGTPLSELSVDGSAGQDTVLEIDVQGATSVKKRMLESGMEVPPSIFILPPSISAVEKRLLDRSTRTGESLASITRRLRNAQDEILQAGGFDYWVLNDDLTEATLRLKVIISLLRSGKRPEAEQFADLRVLKRVQTIAAAV